MLDDRKVRFFRHLPSTPLSHVVASIWYAENEPAHELKRFLPTGEIDLVINVRDGRLRRYELDSIDCPKLRGAGRLRGTLGVKFKLGRAGNFMGVRATIYRTLLNSPGYVTTSPWTSMSTSRTKSVSNDS
jgi:hypothetical protein